MSDPIRHPRGLFNLFDDCWILDGARTPMVDYCGAFAELSPTDLGIHAARAALARAAVDPSEVGAVLAGNMAPGDSFQYMLPRHIGLYAGVPIEVPALMVQRICGTGFELFRQAGLHLRDGIGMALLTGTESMTRNPIAAFEHRSGFKLGAPVKFEDFMWEALKDPAAGVDMIGTAENLARRYGITRAEVDAYAARSFERALAAQAAGFLAGEIAPVTRTTFERAGYAPRALRLPPKVERVETDTHPRPSPVEALARLRPVHPGGVQTAGNSSALVDAAAAAVVANDAVARDWRARTGRTPLARVVAAAVVGVPPEIMGIGPAPAIRLLLQRTGLSLDAIDRFEINEAQGAQVLAVTRELELDEARLNVHGGAIALGHPLAATGVRLTLTCARALRACGGRWGVASACIGGGQGIALLLENPDAPAAT
ncbi:MAG: thiolase family protein [Tepidimonas sp.]|uniref:thiolase family protein n=1 Tax=Tepidimonas sp. TaxID=2002775 RepID=UPI00298F3627|nr:thiolase family protein [Tepidimonas sp.]MDW8337009.1 thiolase family protein [Tepidimonas sp.]